MILGLSHAFGMALDIMVYAFVAAIVYFFVLVDEGLRLVFKRVFVFFSPHDFFLFTTFFPLQFFSLHNFFSLNIFHF